MGYKSKDMFINEVSISKGQGKLFRDPFNTQQTFTCSKSTIETLENGVKYVQS